MTRKEFVKKHDALIGDLWEHGDMSPEIPGQQKGSTETAMAMLRDILTDATGGDFEQDLKRYDLKGAYDWETVRADFNSITD